MDRYAPYTNFSKTRCSASILLNVEKDVRAFMKNERVPLKINDPEYLKPFRKHLTSFAFDKMQTELKDIENVVFDEIRDDGLGIINNGQVTIICDLFKCNSTFRKVVGLPCKHMVQIRQLIEKAVYEETTYMFNVYLVGFAIIDPNILPARERRLTKNQKYNRSRELTARIDEAMSEKSQPLFDVYENFLKNIITLIVENRTNFETLCDVKEAENTERKYFEF